MDYLKLFEQNWWENTKDHGEKLPPVNIDGLVIIKSGGSYYITDGIKNDKITHLYKDYSYMYTFGTSGDFEIVDKNEIPPTQIITIYKNTSWHKYTYKDLPQEIKDRLV